MSSVEDLKKALKNIPCLGIDDDKLAEWIEDFKIKFSVFQKDYEKLRKELSESNLLCELQALKISGLKTFNKQYNSKVSESRKQIEDLLEATKE